MKHISVLILLIGLAGNLFAQDAVRGVAFVDNNQNGRKDKGEKALSGVRVSNGKDVVSTDKKGNYSIERIEGYSIFAVKPADYQFAMDQDFHPQFYQKGHSGVFDIPLYAGPKGDAFSLVLMGDIQVPTIEELNYLGQVAIDELIHTDYEFLIALGDLVANSLPILPDVKDALGETGKANYYVIGNHDRDVGEVENPAVNNDNTFEKDFGPSYYSFDRGDVHFIVLNNIISKKKETPKSSSYYPGIHETQYRFIENDLAHVPNDKLVVLCGHIPFSANEKNGAGTDKSEKGCDISRLLPLLEDYENVMMVAAHTHFQFQNYFDERHGRHNKPIHQLVSGAICGSWWKGERNEYGVPGSIQQDGTPQGYWLMHVKGTDYRLDYKVSGAPLSKQMQIWVPYANRLDKELAYKMDANDVWVNVFAGDENTSVELKLDNGEWQKIGQKDTYDPYVLRHIERLDKNIVPTKDSKLMKGRKVISTHHWYYELPEGLAKGAHTITVRAKNENGLDTVESRTFWIQ